MTSPADGTDSSPAGPPLRSLTAALESADADLDAILGVFVTGLAESVSSFSSAVLTVTVDGYDFAVVSLREPPPGPTASSVSIPLGTVTVSDTATATLILTATSSGAFVDFAADAAFVLGIGLDAVIFDAHLDLSQLVSAANEAVEHRRVVDYAIGIVMERDVHPTVASARTALVDLAEREGFALASIARRIVDGATGRRLRE